MRLTTKGRLCAQVSYLFLAGPLFVLAPTLARAALSVSSVAFAAEPPPPPPPPRLPVFTVGDFITNPATGLLEKVTNRLEDYAVVTDANNVIMLASAVGQTFTCRLSSYRTTR